MGEGRLLCLRLRGQGLRHQLVQVHLCSQNRQNCKTLAKKGAYQRGSRARGQADHLMQSSVPIFATKYSTDHNMGHHIRSWGSPCCLLPIFGTWCSTKGAAILNHGAAMLANCLGKGHGNRLKLTCCVKTCGCCCGCCCCCCTTVGVVATAVAAGGVCAALAGEVII